MNILQYASEKGQPAAATRSAARARGKNDSLGRPRTTDAWNGEERRSGPDRRQSQSRLFLRGTNLQPPGGNVQPCLIGSKQSIMVDLLSRPEGATMEELLDALSGGRKPWTEVSVRAGFGWDMKKKGYGVRSEFDPTGEERFRLIVPKGQHVPPHVDRTGAPGPEKPAPKKSPARKTRTTTKKKR